MGRTKNSLSDKLPSTHTGFATLTRMGLSGLETVFVNPVNVTWVEATPPPPVPEALGDPASTGSTIVHLAGQPMLPLVVTEPVGEVIKALNEATKA